MTGKRRRIDFEGKSREKKIKRNLEMAMKGKKILKAQIIAKTRMGEGGREGGREGRRGYHCNRLRSIERNFFFLFLNKRYRTQLVH